MMSNKLDGRAGRRPALALGAAVAGGLVLLAGAQSASAAVAVVNFDPPGTTLGPSTYVAAGVQQTIATTPATFTGGVVLGFATFFPAIAFATAPNVYGTADFGFGLAKSLDIGINSGFAANEVSFALFNGETFAQSYTATAFDGATQVASQTLFNIPANFNSGFATVDLTASNITRVSIAPLGAQGVWDFLIDTVAFNQTVQQAVGGLPPPAVPPPPVFVPPPPVLITPPSHGNHGGNENEVELELNYGDTLDGRGTLNSLQHVSPILTPPAPVPEPASWALMTVGFGGLGAMLRRRARAIRLA